MPATAEVADAGVPRRLRRQRDAEWLERQRGTLQLGHAALKCFDAFFYCHETTFGSRRSRAASIDPKSNVSPYRSNATWSYLNTVVIVASAAAPNAKPMAIP